MATVASLLVGLIWFQPAPARGSDTVTRWEEFSESVECNDAYTRGPFVTREGLLPNSERVLGPFGTYFGRSIGEIRDQTVLWTVPGSGGRRVWVHRAALPAFQRVAQNLAGHAAAGRVYPIHSAGAFFARTVGGSHQISRHGLGIAIDINPAQNPYRGDGRLITDMPSWFVDAWKDAGFCWGGDWRGPKDSMHFSWIGPGSGIGGPLSPRPPATSKRNFGAIDRAFLTAMSPVMGRYSLMVADGTGNGGPDVVGLRAHPGGAVLDIASGYESFGTCSVRRWFVDDPSVVGADHTLMMDLNSDSRQDLVVLEESGGSTSVRTSLQSQSFDEVTSFSRPISGIAAAAGADWNADHISDLFVAGVDGSLTIYAGPTFNSVLHSGVLPSGAPLHLSAADRDGGNRPEVFAVYPAGSGTRLETLTFSSGWTVDQSLPLGVAPGGIASVGALEYDGDGRADFLLLEASGRLTARVGNSPTGAVATSWFIDPDPDCDDAIPLVFDGRFFDDDGSVHVNGIEWIAAEGITVGCNPPFYDAFCPRSNLTRAQAATFVVRALGLPATDRDFFEDDNGHVLENGVNRVAAAGITVGCNPPANDRFCPDEQMTRAQFATFLVRALGLPATDRDFFVDDDGQVLEGAINRLAASGITSGCNPPANDRFCPGRSLTRAETATFLARAFK